MPHALSLNLQKAPLWCYWLENFQVVDKVKRYNIAWLPRDNWGEEKYEEKHILDVNAQADRCNSAVRWDKQPKDAAIVLNSTCLIDKGSFDGE
jgi:hypothetical protein